MKTPPLSRRTFLQRTAGTTLALGFGLGAVSAAPKSDDIVVKKTRELAAKEKDSQAGKTVADSGKWGATTYSDDGKDMIDSSNRKTTHPKGIKIKPGAI